VSTRPAENVPSTTDATFGIERSRLAFEAAVERGDAAAAAGIYTADATLLAPATDVLHGRLAIERFWRTGLETGIERVELLALDIRQRGDVAFEVGVYALHVATETGGSLVDRGRYLIMHRIEADGWWRRAAEMFGPDSAASVREAATRPRA
jgi:ketosteroid isomerase-like protein